MDDGLAGDVGTIQRSADFVLPASVSNQRLLPPSEWPLLLRDYDRLNQRPVSNDVSPYGCAPFRRDLLSYLKYGLINLDLPAQHKSTDALPWIKRMLEFDESKVRVGDSGGLDLDESGCLTVLLNNSTVLMKREQEASKDYLVVTRMHRKILRTTDLRPTQIIERELSKWKNTRILQEIPSSTSNDPHPSSPLATIDHIAVVEYDSHHRRLLFELTCSGETDVRKLCVHLGLKLGVGSTFEELRRTRSGTLSDMDSMVTLHTVKDGEQQYRTTGNDALLKRAVLPVESLLVDLKRLVVLDSCVDGICTGAVLMMPGLLAYDDGIVIGEEVVLMTVKGEAIAIGYARTGHDQLADDNRRKGPVARVRRVIMERGTYKIHWAQGPEPRLDPPRSGPRRAPVASQPPTQATITTQPPTGAQIPTQPPPSTSPLRITPVSTASAIVVGARPAPSIWSDPPSTSLSQTPTSAVLLPTLAAPIPSSYIATSLPASQTWLSPPIKPPSVPYVASLTPAPFPPPAPLRCIEEAGSSSGRYGASLPMAPPVSSGAGSGIEVGKSAGGEGEAKKARTSGEFLDDLYTELSSSKRRKVEEVAKKDQEGDKQRDVAERKGKEKREGKGKGKGKGTGKER